MPTAQPRYAIYYAPDEDSPLGQFGKQWLSPADRVPPSWVADVDLWAGATESPARYGLHATLKAPFYLAENKSESELLNAVESLAKGRRSFDLPKLKLSKLGRYIALTFDQESRAMADLHQACLLDLDEFRAPLTPADHQRRIDSGLSKRQEELLDLYGYPYVLEQFEFHLTLAGPLDADRLGLVEDLLIERTRSLFYPGLQVSSICVFFQKDRSNAFDLLQRCYLVN